MRTRFLGAAAFLLFSIPALRAVSVDTALSDHFGDSFFAPYWDATSWPPPDFSGVAARTGNWNYNLAFMTGGQSGTDLYWGGLPGQPARSTSQYDASWDVDYGIIKSINDARRNGGSVMFSVGGAAATYMPEGNTSTVSEVVSGYQRMIDTYRVSYLDFDIEGAWIANHAAATVRSQAIVELQRVNTGCRFSFTLPTFSRGLTDDGKYQIRTLLNAGGRLDMVNLMAMDYGDADLPNPQGHMGDAAISAANALFDFLKSEYAGRGISKTDAELWRMVGVTVMIGVNDVTSEVFTQSDARQLLDFAKQKRLGMISMWSQSRDKQGVLGTVSSDGSGIAQTDYEFSGIFNEYNATAIPEPSSWAACGLCAGSAAVVVRRRLRRR